LAASEKVKPEVETALADIVSKVPGAEVAVSDVAPNGVRVKAAQGIADKVAAGTPPQTIGDYLGARLSVDSPQAAADVLNDLHSRFKVLDVSDKIATPKDGYRAIHVQAEVAPGLTAEIQIVPKEINNVQEGLHHIYDKFKRVNPNDLNPEEYAAFQAAKTDVQTQFDAAWAKQAWDVPTAQVGVPGQVTGKAVTEATLAQKLTDIRTKVNWDNIEKGNLDGVIGQIAGEMKGKISDAKRGQITLATQKQMADALGLLPEDLMARQSGQALNSEQIIAAGQLMQASDERLLQLAIEAQKPTASAVDAMKVNEALITHMALIEQFLGASGEAGRALGALRVVHQQGPLSRARGLQVLLDEHGGEEGIKRLSQMITDLNAAGKPPGAINAALSRGWYRWSKDAIQEATAMGYLWRPTTQVRNIVGNVAMAIQQGIDRRAAEKFATILGQETSVAPGEAMAYVRGQLSSLGEAFRTAGKAFTTGERQFEPMLTGTPIEQAQARGVSAASVAQQRRLSAAATQAFTESPFGKAIDFIGGVQRLPGRFLQAEDDFFKVIGYSGEIEAQAHRAAMAQGLVGKDYADAVSKMISNPPENVKLAAVDHAMYATFNNNPGKFASDIMRARNNFLPLYMTLPYVRTPTNLFRVAMEHSPIAPALEQWRADIAAGGAAQSLALAKMTTGSAAMALLYDFAHNGHLTGPMRGEKPYSEAQQGMGIRPMSVRIGKLNVEISGLGQLAPMIAFAGAVNELMANKDVHPEAFDTVDEWTGAVSSIIAYSTADQSYLQGLGKLFGAINDSAKTGAGGAMGAYIRDLASSQMNLLPGVGFARSVGHAMDPQQRQIASFMDALLYKDIPGLSDKLIPMRDVFGHEIAQQPAGKGGQLYNYVSPFRLSWQNDHPAFNEMVRLHTGLERIAWKAAFQNVNVNFRDYPEVLDMYRRLAGNELKYNPKTGEKIGFEDFINRVISGKDPIYSQIYKTRSDPGETGVDSGKSLFIKEWAQAYRQAAQKQIMSEAKTRYPDFYDEIKKGQAHRETQKLPTYLQGQGIEQGQQAVSTAMERPVQDPLPDRFGKPSVVPRRNPTAGGGFAVPSQ
jgi:ppGpp synthetase/RelA/SpoT-type nucleotidyltranferase